MTDAEIPAPEEIILYEKDPATRIATITINRPDQLNAPTIGARRRYGDLIFKASIDDDVKVLVDPRRRRPPRHRRRPRRAHGQAGRRHGAARGVRARRGRRRDPAAARAPTAPAPSLLHWYANPQSGCRSLQEFKKISILEVKGYCYGWHFYQAADADLVISSDDALFGHPAFRYVGLRAAHVAVGA